MDDETHKSILLWIYKVTDEKASEMNIEIALKDGQLLCKLVSA